MHKQLSESNFRSVFSSSQEIRELQTDIEQLHEQQSEILAQEQEANNHLKQLIAIVGSLPGQASATSVLQSDRVFQRNLQLYSANEAKLTDLLSKLAPNQAEVVAERKKQQALQSALLTRSRWLLNRPIDVKTLEQLRVFGTCANGKSWKSLLQELTQVKIDRERLRIRAKQIDWQIAQIESQITICQELETQQDEQVRHVLAPTVTKLDLSPFNAADLPVQSLPSLPKELISAKLKLILLTAITQSQQWFTKTTRMATLVLLLGLTGGSWITNELFTPQIAQADTARITLSLESQPNETYETLLNRAEAVVQGAVEGNFEQNSQIAYVTVTVTAENSGTTAPLISLEVSRTQWQKNPNIQRWGTYFETARSLLGLAATAKTDVATSVIAQQPVNNFVSSLDNTSATIPEPAPPFSTQPPAIATSVVQPSPNLAPVMSEEIDNTNTAEQLPFSTQPPAIATSVVQPSPNLAPALNALEADGTLPVIDQASVSTDSLATEVPQSVPTQGNSQQEFTVASKLLTPRMSQARIARLDLSVESQPNDTYKTLLNRAEAAVRAAVQENFEQNKQVTYVTAMVMAENSGAVAPVLSLEVSRSQWRKSHDVQQWGTYLTSARFLLGFEKPPAINTSATVTENAPLAPQEESKDQLGEEGSDSINPSDIETTPESSEESVDSADGNKTSILNPINLNQVDVNDPVIAPSVTPPQ